jgi:hypothetical protein
MTVGIMTDAGERREEDLRTKLADRALQVEALKRLVSVLEDCADMAELYHECLDRGLDLEELRREAGL